MLGSNQRRLSRRFYRPLLFLMEALHGRFAHEGDGLRACRSPKPTLPGQGKPTSAAPDDDRGPFLLWMARLQVWYPKTNKAPPPPYSKANWSRPISPRYQHGFSTRSGKHGK